MKLQQVKSSDDILAYIEGCLNDFESGISSKKETMADIIDLLIKCVNDKIEKK